MLAKEYRTSFAELYYPARMNKFRQLLFQKAKLIQVYSISYHNLPLIDRQQAIISLKPIKLLFLKFLPK